MFGVVTWSSVQRQFRLWPNAQPCVDLTGVAFLSCWKLNSKKKLKLKPVKFFMARHLRTTGCYRSMVLAILLAVAQPVTAGTRFTYPGGMEG